MAIEYTQPNEVQPLLLLGAGASQPFGIPTMNAFLEDSWRDIDDETIAGCLAVRRSLDVTTSAVVDLEEVMYLLEDLASMEREDALAAPFLERYQHKYSSVRSALPGFTELRRQAQDVREDLRREIYDTCTDYDRDAARQQYEPLFGSLYSFCGQERIYVATTNYDRIIEDLWQGSAEGPHVGDPVLALQTGFHDPTYGNPELDVDRGYPKLADQEDCAIHLIKLHGSLGWREYEVGRVQDTAALEYAAGNTVLAYPIRSDKSDTPPFDDLFEEFDRALADSNFIMIIGNSLRDEAIVSRLTEALRPGEKIAVVIDPNPSSVRNQLPSGVRKYVIPKEEHFGPEGLSPSSEQEWGELVQRTKEQWAETKSD